MSGRDDERAALLLDRWQAILPQIARLRVDLSSLEGERALKAADAWQSTQGYGVSERRMAIDSATAALAAEVYRVKADLDTKQDEVAFLKAAVHAATTGG